MRHVEVAFFQEIGDQQFHFRGHGLDLPCKIAVGDQARNRDRQAHDRRAQCFRNPFGDAVRILRIRIGAKRGKHRDQARDRPQQSEQRRDADDDLQDEQSAFEPHDLVPRTGLHGIEVLRLWPVEMTETHIDDPPESRVIAVHDSREPIGGVFVARADGFDLALQHRRHHQIPPQRQPAQDDHGE